MLDVKTKKFFTNLLLILFIFGTMISSLCQSGNIITVTSSETPEEHAINLYRSMLKDQKGYYNGYEYKRMTGHLKGHPFYDANFSKGTICYDNLNYTDVMILYDILKDELIAGIRDKNSIVEIQLLKVKVQSFSFSGHNFINIQTDSTKSFTLKPGFYELLYEGETGIKVLAKHKKITKEKYDEGDRIFTVHFIEKKTYWICNEGSYNAVRSKKDILHAFPDKEKEVKEFIRNENLNFRSHPEKSLYAIARFYDISTGQNE